MYSLIEARANIVLIARDEKELSKLCSDARIKGCEADYYAVDLRDREALSALCSELHDRYSEVDYFFCNAGKSICRLIEDALDRLHDFDRTMDVNYRSLVALSLAIIPSLVKSKGRIIYTSSVSTLYPAFGGWSAYHSSKVAANMWCRTASKELNDDISNYAARTSFSSVRYNHNAIGMQMTTIGNEHIKWETTTKWNVGLMANMLNNRLSVDFNYYTHKTRNLLTLKTFSSPIAGINKYWTNGGELENKGFELALSGKPVALRDWTLELGATIGHYVNKVTALPDGNYTNSVYGEDNILVSIGNPVALFYGYKTNGV